MNNPLVAQVGATIIALFLGCAFVEHWIARIRRNPNPMLTGRDRRGRAYGGVFIAAVLVVAVVAVIWS